MARKKQQRIPIDGGGSLIQNPFGALDGLEVLPGGLEDSVKVESSVRPEKTSKRGKKNKNRGRVDIIRQTAHRGGKTVTVACNFPPIGELEKKELFAGRGSNQSFLNFLTSSKYFFVSSPDCIQSSVK